jgi:hypothetical protein
LRDSDRWRVLGRRHLEAGFTRQVFDDGGYIQHSTNYQGMALSLGIWSVRLAELSGAEFSQGMLQAIRRLTRSLAVQADRDSGRTPSFGPDDGSHLSRHPRIPGMCGR